MSNIAIRIENIGKQYRIGEKRQVYNTLRDTLVNLAKEPFRRIQRLSGGQGSEEEMMWALKDINLEIREGDVIGLIGHNGAGKTTLLKILSRITAPTTGKIEIYGRIGSLLEVGTGFHPELTGRENIYLNGAILGMRKREIDAKFDEIVAFAEMEKFLDTPVKRYSSGMQVRLAFAVAAHLEPEILLIDEVLAVGDLAFQKKCLGKMENISKEGRTVIFVSHNMSLITSLCEKCVLLDHGKISMIDTAANAVVQYLSISESVTKPVNGRVSLDSNHPGRRKRFDKQVQLTHCSISDDNRQPVDYFVAGQPMNVVIEYSTDASLLNQSIFFAVAISDAQGIRLCYLSSEITDFDVTGQDSGGKVRCRIDRLPFIPGRYYLSLFCRYGSRLSDAIYDAVLFDIIGSTFYSSGRLPPEGSGGYCLLDHSWSVENAEGIR